MEKTTARGVLHERREQFEHLSSVESAFFIFRMAGFHVLFGPSEVHGFPENFLGRVVAEMFAGAGNKNTILNGAR